MRMITSANEFRVRYTAAGAKLIKSQNSIDGILPPSQDFPLNLKLSLENEFLILAELNYLL